MRWDDREDHSLLADAALFVAAGALRVAARVADRLRRGLWLYRHLRGTDEIAGRVETLRAVRAPLSRDRVPAYRLVVELQGDDGAWTVVLDETETGAFEICHPGGRASVEGPVELILAAGMSYRGQEVLDGLSRARRAQLGLDVDEEDIRATEYLLVSGQAVHVLGLAVEEQRPPADRAPYRTPPAIGRLRHPRAGRPVVSAWPRRELLRRLRERPELLPQAARLTGRGSAA
jgi:hypothetical protein